MTVTIAPGIKDGCLLVGGKIILQKVPENVSIAPASSGSAFIGASSTSSSSRHVFTLGVLEGHRFMCIFRFEIWWMIPSFGKSGSEVPIETQMLLLEGSRITASHVEVSDSTPADTYILLLPALVGHFRTSLQGNSANELQLCVESGDPDVQTSQVKEALFVHSGDNPFELMKNSIKILAKHKGSLNHIEDKRVPTHMDWFGWCTWDAFYTTVSPQGIHEGLKSLSSGGCSPKFLIIDDGWQATSNDFLKEGEAPTNCVGFATRLVDIKENVKFKQWKLENYSGGLCEFIETIRERYGLKYIYMWHALLGYWGGLHPECEAMKKYNPKILYPVLSPGDQSHMKCGAMESLVRNGVGLIDPSKIFDFYSDLHSYLAICGADGVKVDIMNVIEGLGSGYGGHVKLMRQYQEALEKSVSEHFKDNNLICSMSQSTDYFYSSKTSAVSRVSEDYMPHIPAIQTSHVAAVAFNSFFQGEITAADWDMFQSTHITADFHGASRAIGGCAVYVSDKPGKHDFEILKKLVLPDGSILRARHAGRPTRDCLFNDPVADGKSLLKIWNINKLSGVLGVFNCQGAGSWNTKIDVGEFKRDTHHEMELSAEETISGHASPRDVELLDNVADENWNGMCAVYGHNSGALQILPKSGSLQLTLGVLKCEILTISPIRVFSVSLHFAPLGLLDMYNSGGALESLDCTNESSGFAVKIQARGQCGRFGAYSSIRPKSCKVEGEDVEIIYTPEDRLLTFTLTGDCSSKQIEIFY